METNLHTESSVNSKICVQIAHRFFSLMRADVLGYRTYELSS